MAGKEGAASNDFSSDNLGNLGQEDFRVKRFRRTLQNIRSDEIIIKELAFSAPTGRVRSLISTQKPSDGHSHSKGDANEHEECPVTDEEEGQVSTNGSSWKVESSQPNDIPSLKVRFEKDRLVVDQQSLTIGLQGDNRQSDNQVTHQQRDSRQGIIHKRVRPMDRWSGEETELFYELLARYGSDFHMISMHLQRRTRHQVKNKFKKEELVQPERVDRALKNRTSK